MLPARLRYWLFDTLSAQAMRYVWAVPTSGATGWIDVGREEGQR